MHAVDEVDIGMARRSEEHGVSCCLAGKRVRRRVRLAKVSLHFDNAAHHRFSSSHQQLSQQLPRDHVGRIKKECPGDESRLDTGCIISHLRL
jgi:hypothetical protein